jgi:hypothetical protein
VIYFCGIDPGNMGALGIVGEQGEFIAAHRWRAGKAQSLYKILYLIKDQVVSVYLEQVRVFPREEKGFITQNQSLLVNSGIWQGWLMLLGLKPVLVAPASWQAAHGLLHWRKQAETNPGQSTPLTLARSLWPAAPLDHQADDGAAVALLLADLARRDHRQGLDRAVLQAHTAAKKAQRRRQIRKLKKLEGLDHAAPQT